MTEQAKTPTRSNPVEAVVRRLIQPRVRNKMSDFKERVINECDGLEQKINMLIEFMHGDIYPTLTATDQGLLMVQLSHMKSYASVLRDRIERFTLTA